MIRNTPYGKRIQSKIQRETAEPRGAYNGGLLPNNMNGMYNPQQMNNGGGMMMNNGQHYFNNGAPQQFMQMPPQQQQFQANDFGRGSPYLNGGGFQPGPGNQFQPFIGDYQQNLQQQQLQNQLQQQQQQNQNQGPYAPFL